MPTEKLICEVDCPSCGEGILIKKETTVHTPAVKADKEEKYLAEKSKQAKLL